MILHTFFHELSGLSHLEKQIEENTNIAKVIVVNGNSDEHEYVKQELGRETVQFLKKTIKNDVTIAVTGGSTMDAVANAMVPLKELMFIRSSTRGNW